MPRLFDLDRYDSCLTSDHGLYCVLRVDLFADESNRLMNQIKEYSAYAAKHYNYTNIDRGVCITQTCKEFIKGRDLEKDIERNQVIEECLNTTMFKQYGLQANVTEIYNCDRHDDKVQIDDTDWIVAGVIAALVFLVLLGTLYDVMHNKISVSKNNMNNEEYYLLMNFSLRKNWNDLVSDESTDPRRNRLKGLRGVRSITNCLMILAHVAFINSAGFMDSPHAVEKTYESFQYHLLYNGLLIVQVFFLMSAFLQSYLMHLRSEVAPFQWSELPIIMFARWWRLSPTYAVLLAFSGTWLRHLGAGPLWRLYVGDSVVAQCRRYWPHHLLYINNYVADDTACQLQTWHIAVDMQLFVVTMLVYMCTRGRGRGWHLALGLLLLVGLLGPPLHVWLQDLQALAMVTPESLVTYFGILVMSVLIALPFYLVVEAPLAGLLLSLLGHTQKTNTKQNKEKIS
ncbi:Nose resistant to fluoxetine protein 6 [Papilio xuthus]|uniref:Nose resistant to fluoxetine protein 6 n=1 Tax=Papilio xuthus TaxID=66420 RepID=A0A0N1PEY2_PAPXU|nr:Nose resistant to fluoxetine protein 6 [Papilio xuthus]